MDSVDGILIGTFSPYSISFLFDINDALRPKRNVICRERFTDIFHSIYECSGYWVQLYNVSLLCSLVHRPPPNSQLGRSGLALRKPIGCFEQSRMPLHMTRVRILTRTGHGRGWGRSPNRHEPLTTLSGSCFCDAPCCDLTRDLSAWEANPFLLRRA